MIVKLVQAAATDGDVGARVFDLGKYIRAGHAHEKLLHAGTRGMLSDDPGVQLAEMAAVATSSAKARQPIMHYVMSWREGEQPTPEHVEQAVNIFMDELGLEDCHAVYGLHGDTANTHLHIMLSRIHPDTGKNIKVSFAALAASRAVARIEAAQGWKPEPGAMFKVLENGEVAQRGPGGVSASESAIPSRIRDAEVRTGEQSALRIAQEQAAPIIREAKTWAELHQGLAAIGMRYTTKGSGAVFYVGNTALKASDVHRSAALGKLQARLGAFEPAVGVEVAAPPEPRPIDDVEPDETWQEYQRQRREAKAARERDYQAQRAELAARRAELKAQSRVLFRRIQGQSWKGRGKELNILRMSAAAEAARARAQLRDDTAAARAQFRAQHPPFPAFEEWLRGAGLNEAADRYRHRGAYGVYSGEFYVEPRGLDIRDFRAVATDAGIDYFREREPDGASFRDEGRIVRVFHSSEPDSMLAAMQLSAEKWPAGFMVKGSEAVKRRSCELAVEHGFKINNAELQGIISELRAARDERKAAEALPLAHSDDAAKTGHTPAPREEMQAMSQAQDIEAYCRAVGADHYRISVKKFFDDDEEKKRQKKDGLTFIFGRATGRELHDAGQVARSIHELNKLDGRGENIYFTPISASVHHVLIDDMSAAKLQQLRAAGYSPAVVIESSPGNFQAILSVPKLGLEESAERDAANALMVEINKMHGDPKLSGIIHAHRVPSFHNRKPTRRRPDGSFPRVNLIEAAGGVCPAARRQLETIAQELAKKRQQVKAAAPRRASATTGDLYSLHHRDIIENRRVNGSDLSRFDWMIATRLRATGHSQDEVESILLAGAPTIRSEESNQHNWPKYARDTAARAFGVAGDIEIDQWRGLHRQWRELEGQELDYTRQLQNDRDDRDDRGPGL